ncbi:hypothetical protein SAMD00019534_094740 [Acytostelium subglobosum LB1]|uniref:hypothetical protein n=1 Tax=Acytostelium subglobosum LB1 TaxID=1410327 RepID=UPI000644B843|nr:hypothetical protein SAMD00019534_094740 [Acytostelium subglobosum LB1]GAM26299.1 hypothetical protein SAMD00019534_094740 [Acytostelium subglobosum LB1]|eukprot:XP_012750853.1 hypothetical protein SAMD00019534_094740 [Acytostelium subglobosum LB1]
MLKSVGVPTVYMTTVVFLHRIVENALYQIFRSIVQHKQYLRESHTGYLPLRQRIDANDVRDIERADPVASLYFPEILQMPDRASLEHPTDYARKINTLLRQIKESDVVLASDNQDDILTPAPMVHKNFKKLIQVIPTEQHVIIANMIGIDISNCLEKTSVVANKFITRIKQITQEQMAVFLYEDNGDDAGEEYSKSQRQKIERWYQYMAEEIEHDGDEEVWFMTPIQAFKVFGNDDDLRRMK